MTSNGANLGFEQKLWQAAMVYNLPKKGTLFSGFIIRFRKYPDAKINEEFLNYLVRSEVYRNYMRRIIAGVTITNINQKFYLPCL